MSDKKPNFAYTRSNHFKRKINIFQSKYCDVPLHVYDIVESELIENGIKCENCTKYIVKQILREHRMTSYYEFSIHISNKISNKQPIILSKETDDTLMEMFNKFLLLSKTNKRFDRISYMNHDYVLYKFFEILKMTDCLENCSLLSNTTKLHRHDTEWRKICEETGWDFYQTVGENDDPFLSEMENLYGHRETSSFMENMIDAKLNK
jgi:hypothetical protein